MEELKRIIEDAEIMQEDDALWPPPDRVGRQVCQFAIVLSNLNGFCVGLTVGKSHRP